MADEPTLSVRVAAEIRVALARADMSKSELARRLGVSAMWVGDRLRGVTPIGLDDLERMAQILGVEPIDLLPHAARAERRDKSGKVPPARGPRDTRPKGRADTVLANRRTTQKRALSAEELTLIEG